VVLGWGDGWVGGCVGGRGGGDMRHLRIVGSGQFGKRDAGLSDSCKNSQKTRPR